MLETNILITGFPAGAAKEAADKVRRLLQKINFQRPPVLKKSFKKKFPNIPTRVDYSGVFEDDFWSGFTKREIVKLPEAWICPDSLVNLAREVGYSEEENLQWAKETLVNGANLGCSGSARLGTKGKNSKKVNEFGDRLVDSLQQWLEDNLACGPLTMEEVEEHWSLSDITVSPMSVRLKPNGKARIIVDMSHPHSDPKDSPDSPASVNSGINKDEFPATMADTRDVLALLHWEGSGAVFCKADWNQACFPTCRARVWCGLITPQLLRLPGPVGIKSHQITNLLNIDKHCRRTNI